MPAIARVGDQTDHGGTIVSGSSDVTTNGIPTARIGDMHSCPISGHGSTPIVTGSGSVTANGIPVARVGDSTGCGATIVSGSPDVTAG